MALFEDVEPDEHPVYIDQPLTLNFRKVSFGYEEGQPVLDRFTAAFHPGSSTAIAGPTGTGKNDHYPADTGFGLSGKGTHRFDN